jgi:hypothetical protein
LKAKAARIEPAQPERLINEERKDRRMASHRQDPMQENVSLTHIREGMSVYDVENDHIGDVDEVYFGAASPTQQELGTGPATVTSADIPRDQPIADAIASIFDPGEIPEELAERLLHSGYIRVDSAGLFAADRYIMPDQIASVSDDEVHLSVSREQLIARR